MSFDNRELLNFRPDYGNMTTHGPPSITPPKREIILEKDVNGKFGFSFSPVEDGSYEISKVTPAVDQYVHKSDILLSINGHTQLLDAYCKSAEAWSMDKWTLVVQAPPHYPSDSYACSDFQPDSMSGDYSSLDFSLVSGGGPEHSVPVDSRQQIVDKALSRPIEIIWSDEIDVRYSQGFDIVIPYIKFKKKQTNTGKQWIILQQIQHTRAVDSTRDVIQVGDHILRLNDVQIPFDCVEGTTAWFRRQLTTLQNQPVTIKIRHPIAIIELRGRLDSTISIRSIAPSEPATAPIQYPPLDRTRNPSRPGYNSVVTIPSINEAVDGPRELTINPDILRGEKILEKCRSSIELQPIERLSRYRLIFHSIGSHNEVVTEKLQCSIFGEIRVLPHGACLKEYHIHASFSESGGTFLHPTKYDCFSSDRPDGLCSFEMHGPTERMFEKTAGDASKREQILSLPDHVASGRFSVGGIKRASIPDNNSKMHIQILSLTGSSAALHKAWCSPVLYCKHAIHVIVVDADTFFSERSEGERDLSRVLSEIKAHSKDYSPEASTTENVTMHSNVLLVITDSERFTAEAIKENIHRKISPHLSSLIVNGDQFPFVICSMPDQIHALLIRELKGASVQQTRFIYPHVAVMLAQRFNNQQMRIIELSQLKDMLNEELSAESCLATDSLIHDTALQYLQNTGIAYVPEISYSASMGRGCPSVVYSILIHPHQLVSCISRLRSAPHAERKELATQKRWTELLRCNTAEKIICIMKELHILLPICKGLANVEEMRFPLMRPCDHTTRQLSPDKPHLVLCYEDNQNFLLLNSLLHHLSNQAVSSDVDYHCSNGRFDIYHGGVYVCRITDTSWGVRTHHPISVTDQGLCFVLTSISEKTSVKQFCKELSQCVNEFYRELSLKPVFGPPCPLAENCRDHRPFHVINTLGPNPPVLSCSGISLQNDSVVMDYVFDGNYAIDPGRVARRDSILNQPANDISLKIIDQLGVRSPLERNWIGLAKVHNFSQSDIEQLAKEDHPARALLRSLSMAYCTYTIRQLFLDLAGMERLDLQHDITSWIDEELEKSSKV